METMTTAVDKHPRGSFIVLHSLEGHPDGQPILFYLMGMQRLAWGLTLHTPLPFFSKQESDVLQWKDRPPPILLRWGGRTACVQCVHASRGCSTFQPHCVTTRAMCEGNIREL